MLNLPKNYQRVKSLPDDPVGSSSFMSQTERSLNFVMQFPISLEEAMSYNSDEIINDIHSCLADNQGLIEVNKGETKNNNLYIYSIVKTLKEPSGVQYTITMHIIDENSATAIQGFFDETGITGERDTAVFAHCMSNNMVSFDDMSNWTKDPYDDNYKKGALMNYSEKAEFDEAFLEHPLSQARILIAEVIKNN